MGSKKGETRNAIIKAIQEGPKNKKELLKLGKRPTVYDNINKLMNNGDIELIEDKDRIEKYVFVDKEKQKIADPTEINLALKYVKSKSQKAKEEAIEDLIRLSEIKKIMDPHAMKSLLKILQKTTEELLQDKLSTIIRWNLQQYKKDMSQKDYEMINELKRGGITNVFRKIAEDTSVKPRTRDTALAVLRLLMDNKVDDIAFKILEEQSDKRAYKEMSEVQSIIISRARIKKQEVREKLYVLLTNGDETVQKRALDLLGKTRLI